MSATGRNVMGHERDARDFYRTPGWCVHALLDLLPDWRPGLEPGAGDGAILTALRERRIRCRGLELDHGLASRARSAGHQVEQCDALGRSWKNQHIIANPPFNQAMAWLAKAVAEARTVVFLLRLSVLGSERRRPFWSAHTPSLVAVLSPRPSFAHGQTDNCEYAWIGWGPLPRPARGQTTLAWLARTERQKGAA